MGTNPVDRGPVGAAVAARIRARREELRLSQVDVSQRLEELGRPMQVSAISKVESNSEKNRRRVDVDDLVAFAAALETTPNMLLLGFDTAPVDPVEALARLQDECSMKTWNDLVGLGMRLADQPELPIPVVAGGLDFLRSTFMRIDEKAEEPDARREVPGFGMGGLSDGER